MNRPADLFALIERLKASPLYCRLRSHKAKVAAKCLRSVVVARWSRS